MLDEADDTMSTCFNLAEREEPIIHLSLGSYEGSVRWFKLTFAPLRCGSINHSSFERAMSMAMTERLLTHGRCAACRESVQTLRRPCPCGDEPPHGYLEVEIEDRCAEPSFNTLLGNWLDATKIANRRAKVRALSVGITTKEVVLLLQWQDSLCFYCGIPFEQDENGPIFHRDHVVPVACDGHFTIENVVLACPRCNHKKGYGDATQFSRLMARLCPPESRAQRTAMRKGFLRKLRVHLKFVQSDSD